MIKAVVFDYAGVVSSGALTGWVKKNTTEENQMLTRFRSQSHKWDLGLLDEKEFKKLISDITMIAPEKVWETFYQPSNYDHEVVELIKKLKNNYKIALFSNNFALFLRRLLEKLNIVELFDEILISSDHKIKKPNPKFFELLLKKLEMNADEVLFIDDTVENVEKAIEIGIPSIHFKNSKQLIRELEKYKIAI